MAKVKFIPQNKEIEVQDGTKILAAAIKSKVPIRFGCGSCRCGSCGITWTGDATLSGMQNDEKALLEKMGLDPTTNNIRLACRAKVEQGEITVDLDFQDTYSPAEYEEEYD